ncbi:M20/M25/M40 family metallo-hydrolase [Longimicrobium sp.]|uniref:M20/M25/M40 family metallo-hydrolase n=1 Tax=Longimicrobium sp. TaxID=2029185 RepID=UPI003B3BA9B6
MQNLIEPAAPTSPDEYRQLARDIFRELVEIDTTDQSGDVTEAAQAVAQRLRQAGFADEDLTLAGPHPRKMNLVARLRGTGARGPLLMLAHLDVVEADPAEWETPPFQFDERDGFYYGRGTIDQKAMASLWAANLIRMRREGIVPDRDLIVVLTADEEGGQHNGARWLVQERRDLIEAVMGINEGGFGRMKGGRRMSNNLQASEKVYLDLELAAHGTAGHSSLPTADNAIYHLAAALSRVAAYEFPVQLGEVARAFFERMSRIDTGPMADDMRALLAGTADADAIARLSAVPQYHGMTRNTWAATRVDAGQSNNTIPHAARAIVNCRLLPGESPDDMERLMNEVIADERITVRQVVNGKPSPPSPLTPEVMQAVESITEQMWPGVPVVPVMGIGATDSLYLRSAGIPIYGVSGIFIDVDDARVHAPNERINIQSYYEGQEFLYRLIRSLS